MNLPVLPAAAWGDFDTLTALAIYIGAPIAVFSVNQHDNLVTHMVSHNIADIYNLLQAGVDVCF